MPLMLRSAILAVAVLASTSASSQQLPGCTAEAMADPPRTVHRCAGGLVIEAEAATEASLTAPGPGTATLDVVELGARAVLVEVGARQQSFQILTPHVIASVRGTLYSVDVEPARTSVFVSEGLVSVERRSDSASVDLGPGEGVDVAVDGPLTVRRWPQERVSRLLARFGR